MKQRYEEEMEKLVELAKKRDFEPKGLDLGKKFFTELLRLYIGQYRHNQITAEELKEKKRQLERDLVNYWDFGEIFERHCDIRNRQSQWLIKAEKEGCPICKELVKIFDGRAAPADGSRSETGGKQK